MADYSMANRRIAYTLGRGRAYIFDTSSTSGYMGEKYVQEFVPHFLTCPHSVGTWVKHIFRNLIPGVRRVRLCLTCHVLNVACHGVSISIVSIISVSCRVRVLRVSVSMPCRGHLDVWHLTIWNAEPFVQLLRMIMLSFDKQLSSQG